MSGERLSLKLITIPGSDDAFRAHVMSVAAGGADTPAGLQQRLKEMFPRVFVRERELSGERETWYVYRDGRWMSPEGLIYTDPSGRYLDANVAATELLAVTLDELLASSPGRFSFAPSPTADAEQAALMQQWDGTSPLVGQGGLRRGDGSAIRVTFAIEPRESGFLLRLSRIDGPPEAAPTLFAIGDVRREWRAAERTLAELQPGTPEWARLDSQIAVLEERYQSLFYAAKQSG